MTIVADSGSTKTTWIDVTSGNKIVTEGLNPHFTSDEQFLAACDEVRKHIFHSPLSTLHFYGAGCGNDGQRQRVVKLLSEGLACEHVVVETDMLGACRAVCGDRPGLVGILGTGSNACYYDGQKIVYQAPSTGYILGDHGSANYVGRKLLQYYLSGMLPDDVAACFHEEYPLTYGEFIDAVYHKPNANRFLASLAPFALKHGRYSCINTILEDGFEDWIFYQILEIMIKSECHDLCIVGGFAKAMEKRIRRYAKNTPLTIVKIIADPIDGLRKYHKTHTEFQ